MNKNISSQASCLSVKVGLPARVGLPALAGFTLIELLFAIALSALFLPALVFVFSFSLGSASQGESYTQAYSLAQEQMEAIYFIKENDPNNEWGWTPTSPMNTSGNYYQPQKVGGSSWELGSTTSNPAEMDGYTKAVVIEEVRRNAAGDIVTAGGTIDNNSRKVIVTVSWKEKGEPTSIELVSYVTNH